MYWVLVGGGRGKKRTRELHCCTPLAAMSRLRSEKSGWDLGYPNIGMYAPSSKLNRRGILVAICSCLSVHQQHWFQREFRSWSSREESYRRKREKGHSERICQGPRSATRNVSHGAGVPAGRSQGDGEALFI